MSEEPKARMVKIATRHNCHEAIADVDKPEYYIGSIVECFCGKQFVKMDTQFYGPEWHPMP